jgi:hypothetical protein
VGELWAHPDSARTIVRARMRPQRPERRRLPGNRRHEEMVEAPGVEPGSKGMVIEASTSVLRDLVSRRRTSADRIPWRYPDCVPGGPRARAYGQVGLGDALTLLSNSERAGRAAD